MRSHSNRACRGTPGTPVAWIGTVALLLLVPGLVPLPEATVVAGNRAGVHATTAPIRPAPPPGGLPAAPGADWPQFHRAANLSGSVVDGSLSSKNASRLGVSWATNTYGPALDSPAIAYDPILGEQLAYIGTESGFVLAVNLADGQIQWGEWVGSPIRSSPLVADGAVFAGTFSNPMLIKLNATTGATDCSYLTAQPIEGTPTYASPPGGVPTVYLGTEDSGTQNGPLLAIRAADCTLEWSFGNYTQTADIWVPAGYGLTSHGQPLVVFGTSDPDSGVYAVNAVTGALVWRFQAANPGAAVYDIGAGAVVAQAGMNGFGAGVAYVPSKYGLMYALSLNNGTPLWTTNFEQAVGVPNGTDGGRSTAALFATNLVFGTPKGLIDLNAKTGTPIWKYTDPSGTEAISSPAIAGRLRSFLVAVGDVAGGFDVVALSTGHQLYHYQTGGYITASPAISGGSIVISSTDGYLYDFRVGGGNDVVLPATSVSSPVEGASLLNPNGNSSIAGNATDPRGVQGVEVAIQSSGTGGPWWDAATLTWVPGPFANLAALANPGAKSTSWSLSFPVPRAGGTFQVTTDARSTAGQSDILASHVDFEVQYSTLGPHLQTSASYIAPGWGTTVNGGGFQAGETVAISVHGVTIKNLTASSSGALPATRVTIPESTPFGPTSLEATGQTSGKTTTAAIIVANSWDQFGYDVGHTGFEPSDPALNFLVTPGNNTWVRLAWHFDAGHPLNASPVIADGVAYVADTAGHLDAVAITNGGLLWTWTLPSGRAIDSTPAINATAGLIFVSATDGTLSAVSTATGRTNWSVTLGGEITPPTLADGRVYVASSAGLVEALSQNNGTVDWSATLGSGISGAPALNLTANLLVVGTSAGNVTSFAANNGSKLWTFAAGGSVPAAVTLSGGVVYFGSTNDKVYALNQSTGRAIWSFKTGGAVIDTGTLSDRYSGGSLVLMIGSSDGILHLLYASTGKPKFSFNLSSAVEGVASVEGIVVSELLDGAISAGRTYTNIITLRDVTLGPLVSSPAIVDSTIYVTGQDGYLYAYTTYGQAPD